MSEEGLSYDQMNWSFLFPPNDYSLNMANAGVPGLNPSLLHDPADNYSKSSSEPDTDAEHDDNDAEHDDAEPDHDTDVDGDTIEVVSYSTSGYQKTASATTNHSALPPPPTTTPEHDDTEPEHDTNVDGDTIEVVSYSTSGYQKTASATTTHSALPPPLTATAAAAKRRTSDKATAGGPSKKPKVSHTGKSPKSAEKPALWPTPNPTPSSVVSATENWLAKPGDLLVPRASPAWGMIKLVGELEKRAMEAEQGMIAAEQRASAAEERAIKAEQDKTNGAMGGTKWSTGKRK
jgi:hypothetical protein